MRFLVIYGLRQLSNNLKVSLYICIFCSNDGIMQELDEMRASNMVLKL